MPAPTPQTTLFGIEEPVDGPTGDTGPVAAIALEDSLDKLLDYAIPPRLMTRLAVGQRVRVPLGRGNRVALGYVIALKDFSAYPKVKAIGEIEDERVLV